MRNIQCQWMYLCAINLSEYGILNIAQIHFFCIKHNRL